jgi:hypothetical protein
MVIQDLDRLDKDFELGSHPTFCNARHQRKQKKKPEKHSSFPLDHSLKSCLTPSKTRES